jgi:uncharacterized SAM-binding protein YcdF (DUF218 family)
MFFYLSKTLTFLAMPVTLIVLAFLLSWFLKKKRQTLFWVGMGLLLLFTNLFMSNALLRWWEDEPVAIESLSHYDIGIVLGGITSDKEPRDRVHTSGAADRILHVVQLYRLGKIDKILVSGGTGKIIEDEVKEAVLLERLLRLSKVPEEDILVEDASRNTYENALNSKDLLSQRSEAGHQYLLITSAFHMPRAKACFDKVGLKVDTFSADFRTDEHQFTPDALFIPSSAAIGNWEIVIRELLGMVAYKVRGYI